MAMFMWFVCQASERDKVLRSTDRMVQKVHQEYAKAKWQGVKSILVTFNFKKSICIIHLNGLCMTNSMRRLI